MQKRAHLVDLVKSFPTTIYLQNLASIQRRASPVKFAHLAEKSEKGSVSNLSTFRRPLLRLRRDLRVPCEVGHAVDAAVGVVLVEYRPGPFISGILILRFDEGGRTYT